MPNPSRQIFRQLAGKLTRSILGLSVSETDKWCSFHQKGGKKFAYILLTKHKSKIDVWCLGNVDYIQQKYSTKIKFKLRQKTTGGFGKDFQINFVVENQDDIENATLLLTEISNSWSKEELISAFNLYCKIPINEIRTDNKRIIEFASLLGRTPKEVAKRFANFSKMDAATDALGNIDYDDKETWKYFNDDWEKSVNESEKQIVALEYKLKNITKIPDGKERERLVKSRINQDFFRMAVLSSYQNKCCITGLPFPDLLNASHIIPWKDDTANRLNPRNGLCLNTLHDRAFDRGFITVMPDYTVNVSSYIRDMLDEKSVADYFMRYQGLKINLPSRFIPEKSFLEFHNKKIFKI